MIVKDILTTLYCLSILFSAVAAIVFRQWLAKRLLTPFIFLLLYVLVQELLFTFDDRSDWFGSNTVVYNIYRLGLVLFFAFVYSRLPFMKEMRGYIITLAVIFCLFFLVNFTFIQPITSVSSYIVLSRGLVVSLFAVFFLFRYFHLDDRQQAEFWSPWIWITTGILVFYPVVSISQTFQRYLYLKEATVYGFKLYQLIPQVMSIFMYSCFSYAFYLCKKIR